MIDVSEAFVLNTNDLSHLTMRTLASKNEWDHSYFESWPHEPNASILDTDGNILVSEIYPSTQCALWELPRVGVAYLYMCDGTLNATGVGSTPEDAKKIVRTIRERIPKRDATTEGFVPVNFWSATPHGGRNRRRDIDIVSWGEIADNYPSPERLSELMSRDFRPGVGGQLILWHGDAGTGKTTALRALADAWRDWCDFHYIVDPDAFFGHRADYMLEVLTGSDEDERGRWRLLVLEDYGEMFHPDARKEVGQALARLLNSCDGLIGRGLRFLILVTTNEKVSRLHEAISRPGRCAARVEFARFTSLEAYRWLAKHKVSRDVDAGVTLADLYGYLGDFGESQPERKVGFASV